MKLKILNITLILLVITSSKVKCTNIEARDEKTFPNGTLVGKYAYVDAQGNEVLVQYFADGKSYSIDLKGYKIPEDEAQATRNSTAINALPTTDPIDTMVPLKLDFPMVDNIYTIENQPNVTNDIVNGKEKCQGGNANDNQPEDYDVYDSNTKIPKTESYEKDKEIKNKKVIRKIRQTLDIFIRKIPIS